MSVQLKTSSGLIPISTTPDILTYTLSKNNNNEIVLTCSNGVQTKITDKDTTYTFSETNHVLTITGSDGTTKDIQLGGEITKAAIEEALGFTPLQASDIANKADKATTLEGYGITDAVSSDDSRLSDARPASDVKDWAKADNKPSYTASEVGALADTTTHLSGDIATTEKGANNGVATLGSDGKIPSSQLPSYVDDVLEYNNKSSFPSTGESGKIYIDIEKNITYRWGGTVYVEVGSSLALGETSSTAYAGDKGKAVTDAFNTHKDDTDIHVTADLKSNYDAAYTHSTSTHARTDATKVESSTTNGNIKINEVDTNVYTHPSYNEKSSGFYKLSVDSIGHISETTAVTKDDITGLGIPAQDTTYENATQTKSGLMSSDDKTKLDGFTFKMGEDTSGIFIQRLS